MSPLSLGVSDETFMRAAIASASAAETAGNLPIGCVVVVDRVIIARAFNEMFFPTYSPTRHAELLAIASLDGELLRVRSREVTIFSTLEPCPMCFGAIIVARLGRVVFGARDPEGGSATLWRHDANLYSSDAMPSVAGGVLESECASLYQRARAQFHAYSRSG